MKLGFEEDQAVFESSSQNVRVLSEHWAGTNLFCPACQHVKLNCFPNNRPAADFYCERCKEEFELKSQTKKFGKKVLDGAYDTLIERLKAENNPNFLFLNYDKSPMRVTNLFVVPKHFFTPLIIERRKPLSMTARRSGWVGCNILLSALPISSRIFLVRDGVPESRDTVAANWKRTSFLAEERLESRGWLLDVMRCVEKIGRPNFTLEQVYAFEESLKKIYPENNHVRPKIRQQLQRLRDYGFLEFEGRGTYRLSDLPAKLECP